MGKLLDSLQLSHKVFMVIPKRIICVCCDSIEDHLQYTCGSSGRSLFCTKSGVPDLNVGMVKLQVTLRPL